MEYSESLPTASPASRVSAQNVTDYTTATLREPTTVEQLSHHRHHHHHHHHHHPKTEAITGPYQLSWHASETPVLFFYMAGKQIIIVTLCSPVSVLPHGVALTALKSTPSRMCCVWTVSTLVWNPSALKQRNLSLPQSPVSVVCCCSYPTPFILLCSTFQIPDIQN